MIARGPTVIDPQYRNYSATQNTNRLVGWGGTNDLATGTNAATTYARIVSYGTARKAAGWRVILIGVLPRGSLPSFETARSTVNASLLADFPTPTAFPNIYTGGAYADYFIDIGADANIGVAGSQSNPTYYDADLIHLNNTGYGVVAGYVLNAISLLP